MPDNKNITILKNPLAIKNMVDLISFTGVKIGEFEIVCKLKPPCRKYKSKGLHYFLDNDSLKEILDSVAIGSKYNISKFRRDGAFYNYVINIIMPIEEEIPVGVAVPKSDSQMGAERTMETLLRTLSIIFKERP